MTGPGCDEDDVEVCLRCGFPLTIIDPHAEWRKPLGRDTYDYCNECARIVIAERQRAKIK